MPKIWPVIIDIFTFDENVVKATLPMIKYLCFVDFLSFQINGSIGCMHGAGHHLFPAINCIICTYLIALPISVYLMFYTFRISIPETSRFVFAESLWCN